MSFAQKYKDSTQHSWVLYTCIPDSKSLSTFFMLLLSFRKTQLLLSLFLETGFQGQAHPFAGQKVSRTQPLNKPGVQKIKEVGATGVREVFDFVVSGQSGPFIPHSRTLLSPKEEGAEADIARQTHHAPSSCNRNSLPSSCSFLDNLFSSSKPSSISQVFLNPHHGREVFTSGSSPFYNLLGLWSTTINPGYSMCYIGLSGSFQKTPSSLKFFQ